MITKSWLWLPTFFLLFSCARVSNFTEVPDPKLHAGGDENFAFLFEGVPLVVESEGRKVPVYPGATVSAGNKTY